MQAKAGAVLFPREVFSAIRTLNYINTSSRRAGPPVRADRGSQGMLDQFWLWSMQGGLENIYDSIKAFSEADFTEELKKFDVPTLVMHGEDDQVVPIKDSAKKSARLIKGAKEIYDPGRPTVSRLRTRMKSTPTC
jgi:pimeloyl-ACP methyl ester carboxylesterase